MSTLAMILLLQGGIFFGEYYGEPAGCGWACEEGECTNLPSCQPLLPPHIGDWPLIRLEPQTGFGFSAPQIGFDYIVSGPFHHTIPNFLIDWQVQVFIGFAEDDTIFPAAATGTVDVTMWVKPTIQPFMDRINSNYTYTISVPNDPDFIGVEMFHQVVMWWISPSGTFRITASRGLKTTVEG